MGAVGHDVFTGRQPADQQTTFAVGQLRIGGLADQRVTEQRDITTTVTHGDHNKLKA